MDVKQQAAVLLGIELNGRNHQLVLGFGTPWDEATQVIEGFKLALDEMKRQSDVQQAPEAPVAEEVPADQVSVE